MSRSYTQQGQSGTIPYDEYLRKIQQTDLREDPNQYEKYLRKQLVDFRPDAPFFESDQTRDPNDRGSGNGSRERLALRHSGARSEEDPYLPDGTFLDHEFMERDPRGTQVGPDMNASRKQREARARFVKFYDDSDNSVPETGINPVQMVTLIRGAQQQFKDRWKNFDESMDSWHNGSAAVRGDRSSVAMVTTDGTIVNLADAVQQLRQDPVNTLSNRTPAMLRHTAPDHRVKTSKYGMVRPVMDMDYNAWNTNRYNSYLDHQIPIEINGQMVNRGLAMMILDLEGQRATKQIVTHGTDYDDSQVNLLREMQQRINPEDLYKMIMIGMTSQTQSKSANQEFFEGSHLARTGGKFKGDVRKLLNAGEINHDIAISMVQSNRELGMQRTADLRQNITKSAADYGLYKEAGNRPSSIKKIKNTLVREGLDVRDVEDHKETKTYGGIKPSENYNPHEVLDFEEYAKKSKTTQHRKMNAKKMKTRSVDDTVNDADMGEFDLPGARHSRDAGINNGRQTQADFGDILRKDSDDAANLHDTLYNMVLNG